MASARLDSAVSFLWSIPLERPPGRTGDVPDAAERRPPPPEYDLQSRFFDKDSSAFVHDDLSSAPTGAASRPIHTDSVTTIADVAPPPLRKPLFANCPAKHIAIWQRSLTPHLLGSRTFISRYGGSPIVVMSMIRASSTTDPRHSIEHADIDLDAIDLQPGKHGISYLHLLETTPVSSYNPRLLDDPDMRLGSNRIIMNLTGYMASVVAFVRTKDLRLELNERFQVNHQWLNPSMTLSKIRSLKFKILTVLRQIDMEISTAALTCAYFEMLVLKGIVNKANRHVIGAACAVLASKFNTSAQSASFLLDNLCEALRIRKRTVLDLELYVFVQLEFNLHITPAQILPHFTRLLQQIDSDVVEYLGKEVYEAFCVSLGLETI